MSDAAIRDAAIEAIRRAADLQKVPPGSEGEKLRWMVEQLLRSANPRPWLTSIGAVALLAIERRDAAQRAALAGRGRATTHAAATHDAAEER